MWSIPKCVRFLVLCILHNRHPKYPTCSWLSWHLCLVAFFWPLLIFCCCCYICGWSYLLGSRVALQCYITKWIGYHCCCLAAQSCPPLCNPRNSSPPGSSLSPLLSWDFPARSREWVAVSSFRGSSQPRDWTLTPSLLHCRRILYLWATEEAQISYMKCHELPDVQAGFRKGRRTRD